MTEKEIQKEEKVEEITEKVEVVSNEKTTDSVEDKTDVVVDAKKPFPARAPFKKNFNSRKRKKFEKPRSEFDQKIIKIRRVTRVMSGGRRFSFSVAMVLGNKRGKVGVGIAKAGDTALAIEKAVKNAKKNMVELKLTKNNSIPYDVENKYCASVIKILPTKEGKGLSAGSAVKTVLELAGITDVTAKVLSRSKNQLNIAMSTVEALKDFQK
ncbi:30S ribosomal protein S5 [Patescibacteria group bacterium]|nr:30S ribosomal protein S5 [Patescibacteria group bacterium]